MDKTTINGPINGRIKFRHLQCFLAVAQHASLQKAAASLSLTQPAVSKTIKELETLLGMRLFDRGRRGTQMTRQGEVFAGYAQTAIHALQQATNFMHAGRGKAASVIRIGATPAMTTSFVPQALMRFHQRVGNVQASVLTGTTRYLMDQLRDGDHDLVLCRHLDPEEMAGLSFEYLYADPLVAVVRPGHPLLASNAGGPFTAVLPPKTSINRQAAAPLAQALDIGPIEDFIESLSISFGRTYALHSDAIWFVPWGAVKLDVQAGALVKLEPTAQNPDAAAVIMARSTGLLMRSNFSPTPAMQLLIGAIRECAAEWRTEVF